MHFCHSAQCDIGAGSFSASYYIHSRFHRLNTMHARVFRLILGTQSYHYPSTYSFGFFPPNKARNVNFSMCWMFSVHILHAKNTQTKAMEHERDGIIVTTDGHTCICFAPSRLLLLTVCVCVGACMCSCPLVHCCFKCFQSSEFLSFLVYLGCMSVWVFWFSFCCQKHFFTYRLWFPKYLDIHKSECSISIYPRE